jgi:hypothetical protein
MRSARHRRRGVIDLRRITIGDWVLVAASVMAVASLFLPWSTSSIAPRAQWAFTYSEWASVTVIVFFLATVFLVIYPALSPDLGLPPLPFATPLIFFMMGATLILLFTYQLGKYACIGCATGRGIGIWVALISAVVYTIGAVIKWGSRPARRA